MISQDQTPQDPEGCLITHSQCKDTFQGMIKELKIPKAENLQDQNHTLSDF